MAALIVLLNKPFGVLSQFTSQEGHRTLADFVDVPNVYAAGRLDKDSEGLLVLTDDGALQHQIASPKARKKMPKTYWVQVEREPQEDDLERLRRGVKLKDGLTRPAKVRRMDPPDLWPRDPPIRARKSIPTAWLEVVLKEGRNRQVRRMTAHIGFPTLRLVRHAIGPWSVDGLAPGRTRIL